MVDRITSYNVCYTKLLRVPDEIGQWWLDFLAADGEARATMLLPQQPGEAKKRRRRKRKPAAARTEPAA